MPSSHPQGKNGGEERRRGQYEGEIASQGPCVHSVRALAVHESNIIRIPRIYCGIIIACIHIASDL